LGDAGEMIYFRGAKLPEPELSGKSAIVLR
jgi:hypothetical protein